MRIIERDFAKPINDLNRELYIAQLVYQKELAVGEFETITQQLKPMTWNEFLAAAKGVN